MPCDVVAGHFGAQDSVVPGVLLDGAILVIASNRGIAKMEIFDCGLKLALVKLRNSTAKYDTELVRASDGAVDIEQPVAQSIESSPASKDEVVTILGLRKEKPMLATGFAALCFRKEGSEVGEPLLAACDDVIRQHGICELLESLWSTAAQEGIGALFEPNAAIPQAVGEPEVLV